MAMLKNHKNIQSPQQFNPPTRYEDATNGGYCYVYDPAAWRNKNKPSGEMTNSGPEAK